MAFLLICLILCFSGSDILVFYVFFERRVIPVFCIVLGLGGQPERGEASLYLIFYTLAGSFPLFYYILTKLEKGGSYIIGFGGASLRSLLLVFFILVAFIVKFPIYGCHL